jgi:rare lipoprotein A
MIKKLSAVTTIVFALSFGEALAQPVTVIASHYGVGDGFHGRKTANGERFDALAFTAAHRHLPFGTRLRVTNPRTGQSVVVRINDRGPFVHGRGIDLSTGAARIIGIRGTAPVIVEKI